MTQTPELPEGVRYTIIRKRIIKRPKSRKRAKPKRNNYPVLMSVRGS